MSINPPIAIESGAFPHGDFKIITELVHQIVRFLEKVVPHGLPMQRPVAAIYFREVIVEFILGDVRVDF